MIREMHHRYPTVDVYTDYEQDNLTANNNMQVMLSPTPNEENYKDYCMYLDNFDDEFESGDMEPYGGRCIDLPVDVYACDDFRMYEFKVRKCARGRSHDWTECPYVHSGEKARRRDPQKYRYSGQACPEYRKGNCVRGDGCEFAHGVFECWLHPSRYRTQVCKDGGMCKRRVCFFAHSPGQLRVVPPGPNELSYNSSGLDYAKPFISSPDESSSPSVGGSSSASEIMASLAQLKLSRLNSMPSSWNLQMGSPRLPVARPGFLSLPATPVAGLTRPGNTGFEEEPLMERVESGKGLRARLFEKLSKENPLNG